MDHGWWLKSSTLSVVRSQLFHYQELRLDEFKLNLCRRTYVLQFF